MSSTDVKKKVNDFIINNINGLGLGNLLDKSSHLENSIRYWYFIKHILVPNNIYQIRYSREFLQQRQYFSKSCENDVKNIEKILVKGNKGGISINKLMSNNIKNKPGYFDKMLHMMKMHHLHLDPNFGYKRSPELLFVIFCGDIAHVVYLGDHSNLCDPDLLEIAYDNWPYLFKMKFLTSSISRPTKQEITDNNYVSFAFSMKDGYSVMLTQSTFNVIDSQNNVIKSKGGHFKSTLAYSDWALDKIDAIEKLSNFQILEIKNTHAHVIGMLVKTTDYTKQDYFDCKSLPNIIPHPFIIWEKFKQTRPNDPIPFVIYL